MKKLLLSAFLIIFSMSCSTTADSSLDKDTLPFFGKYRAFRFVLDNKLKLIVIRDTSSPTFSMQTWFDVGSRHERKGYTGLAHLFEHMMFKQTKNLKEGEFDKILEEAGAEGENAFTSHDYTAYVQELPSDKLELVLKLESDRMVNLIVDDKAFKTEREVVQNERRFRNENSPDGTLWQELFGLAYTKHPYHWPVIGYEEDLKRMTAEDARKFYESYYTPSRATVVLVGDIDPYQALKLARQYYGKIGNRELPKELQTKIVQEPTQKSVRRKSVKLNIKVEKLMMSYPVPGIAHHDMPALNIIEALLSEGKNSRFERNLIDTGIASSAESGTYENVDPSVFVFTVNLQNNKPAKTAENIILKELEDLKTKPITETELKKAKNIFQFQFIDGLSTNYQKAHFIGQYETVLGHFKEGLRNIDALQNVTALDVQRVAKKYFSPNARTVLIGVKK
ncbi:MAG: insulinase family protein [Xanthomonadaceae bacterium]|nr:insulinase family protein [Xanthomonadaceae bacterium]